MNTEDLLRSTLRDKAQTAHSTLTLDDVRRGADARRRHAGRRTALLAAAGVVVAIGAPTAFLLRPSDNAPSPAPSPTPPASTVPSATPKVLQAIAQGRAPGITYLQDGTVHFGDGSTTRLPDPKAPVSAFTSYHGGWLVATGGGEDRVRWYDNTGARASDGPGIGIFAVSEDGTQTAYAQSGAIHIGISSGMGEGEQTVSGRGALELWPVGFLRGGALVYQAGENHVAVIGGGTLPGMSIARAVSAEADLVAGEDRDGNTLVLTGSGHVAWTSKTWAVWQFSPDGRYASATDSPTGGDFSAVAILDARTGHVVAQHPLLANGISVDGHPLMDDDGSLLVPATDGNTLEQTVLRLDREGTLTRATEVFAQDPASDSSFVVFATRP
jgi:hypothetical protein